MSISLEGARKTVREIIGEGEAAPTPYIPFTPRAKKVLELSLHQATEPDQRDVGTERLLIALIHEESGVAIAVLRELGADVAQIRDAVVRLIAERDLDSSGSD